MPRSSLQVSSTSTEGSERLRWMSRRSGNFSKRMMENKDQPKKPLTAEDLLAMDPDEVHDWASRKLAERLAEHEQRAAEKRTEQDSPQE